MKIEILDRPNFAQLDARYRAVDEEYSLAPAKKCGTNDGSGDLSQSLDRLGKKLPIQAQKCLRDVRFRVLRSLLRCAGEATGYSVAHVSVLLGVTERTVRNWIVEAELGLLYFGPASSARTWYRGVVRGTATDLNGSYPVGPKRTMWYATYAEAVRRARMIWHSYRISTGKIEVEVKKMRKK